MTDRADEEVGGVFRWAPQEIKPRHLDERGMVSLSAVCALFDRAIAAFGLTLGLSEAYTREHARSYFAAEVHVRLMLPLAPGDRVAIEVRIVDCDSKRIHWWAEMRSLQEGRLRATFEQMSLHVDMVRRRVVPFGPPILDRIRALHAAQVALPRPELAERPIDFMRLPEVGSHAHESG